MNLPNKITVFRICMIPIFLFFYLAAPLGEPYSYWVALAVFVIASASDALDGYIARSRGLVTNFGKLMDPLADKLLVSAALVALTEQHLLPAWVTVVIISREFLITGLRQLALEQGIVIAASVWGKLKTITQTIMIIGLLAGLQQFGAAGGIAAAVLVWASVAATVGSALDYVYKSKEVFK